MKFLIFLSLVSHLAFAQGTEVREMKNRDNLESSDLTPLNEPDDDRLLIDDVDPGNMVKGQEDPMEQEDDQFWRDHTPQTDEEVED